MSWVLVVLLCGCAGNRAGDQPANRDVGAADRPGTAMDAPMGTQAGTLDAGSQPAPDAVVAPDAGPDSAPGGSPDAPGGVSADAAPDAPADLKEVAGGDPSDACGRPPEDVRVVNGLRDYVDMILNGSAFDDHEGQRIYLFTRHPETGRPLGVAAATIRQGRFVIRLIDGYTRFSYQPVFFYVDVNGDGRCNAADGDHSSWFPTNGHNGNDPIVIDLTEARYGHRTAPPREGGTVCDIMNACR